MDLVFIDEQFGKNERGNYTAILATVFREEIIDQYRKEFVSEYVKILGLGISTEGQKTIHVSLPTLHGSEMLPEYDDDIKISIYQLVCRLVAKYKVKVIRAGYYDLSIASFFELKNSSERVSFCISRLEVFLKGFFQNNYMFVYELDAVNLSRLRYNDINTINAIAQYPCPEHDTVIDASKCIGKFYCNKQNYCMYASDITGYLLKKNSAKTQSKFVKNILGAIDQIHDQVLLNEIIFMNYVTNID